MLFHDCLILGARIALLSYAYIVPGGNVSVQLSSMLCLIGTFSGRAQEHLGHQCRHTARTAGHCFEVDCDSVPVSILVDALLVSVIIGVNSAVCVVILILTSHYSLTTVRVSPKPARVVTRRR
jgi:hypothetical protein